MYTNKGSLWEYMSHDHQLLSHDCQLLSHDCQLLSHDHFLSYRPFDASLYEDEMEEEGELLDEDGRARLKLKVENTIRWRKKINEEGTEEKESNARIVQWTDGRFVDDECIPNNAQLSTTHTHPLCLSLSSMSLYLGSEIFDIHKQPLQGEFSHLFVRQGTTIIHVHVRVYVHVHVQCNIIGAVLCVQMLIILNKGNNLMYYLIKALVYRGKLYSRVNSHSDLIQLIVKHTER